MNNLTDNLRIASLNVKGITGYEKKIKVKNWVREKKVDVLCIQECHVGSLKLKKILNANHAVFSDGDAHSKGVAVFVMNEAEIISSKIFREGRHCATEIKIAENRIVIHSIYAPNVVDSVASKVAYNDFILSVEAAIRTEFSNKVNLLLGDFNLPINPTLDVRNRRTTIPTECVDALSLSLEGLNLVDSFRVKHPGKNEHSFSPQGPNLREIFSRIDFCFTSLAMTDSMSSIGYEETGISDHKALLIDWITVRKPGKGLWKINESIMGEPDDFKFIEGAIGSVRAQHTDMNCRDQWDLIKFRIGEYFRKKASRLSAAEKAEKKEILMQVQAEEEKLRKGSHNNVGLAKQKLESVIAKETKRLIFNAQCQFVEEDERSSKFFYRRIARRGKEKCIERMKDDQGFIMHDEKTIGEHITNFYKRLYSTRPTSKEGFTDLIQDKLSETQTQSSGRPITRNEAYNALKAMKGGKAPGDDGLTVNFYKCFWSILAPSIMGCFEEALTEGSLSTSQKRSVIKLLLKKGKDPLDIKNYRPISLINTDAKIFSKIAANRLRRPMDNIIKSDQKAFVQGRLMHEGIMNQRVLIERVKKEKIKGALVGIDFEKAFDSVEHPMMWEAIARFGYDPFLINMIKTLYKGANSAVMNNGHKLETFSIERSCRQGDCVSPYLFLIAIEPLLIRIRNELPGINLYGLTCKLFGFADDLQVWVNSKEELETLLDILRNFTKESGLRVNCSKCEMLGLGLAVCTLYANL